jgi:type IV pilus assembly protein PilW
MKHHQPSAYNQRGVTLIELMVAMAITLFVVAAAAYVYLGTREAQRAIDANASNNDVGNFALQLIGQEIMKAGSYPATVPQFGSTDKKVMSYANAVATSNWSTAPALANAYQNFLFGCEGATFNPSTGLCGTTVSGNPDSIVINHFTNESLNMLRDNSDGDRTDCTGAIVDRDGINALRHGRANTTTSTTPDTPTQPLFASNRYTITSNQSVEVDKQTVVTSSLGCNGNGANGSVPGAASDLYQPILNGIVDLQITYGVFSATADTSSRVPDKFYTATEVGNLGSMDVDVGIQRLSVEPWSRIAAVRVCLMTQSIGGSPRIADKTGALRSYVDCKEQTVTQALGDTRLFKRFVRVFPVRNRLNQVF